MYAAREPAGSGGSTMDDFIAELKTIDSPTLANAIELLDVRDRTDGYADLNLRCLLSQPGAMVGYAVTVTMDTTTPGPPPADKRTLELWRAVEAAPRPSVLVFQEVGPRPSIGCHGGDVMATVGRRLGCVGLVSGSGLRDIDEIRDIGLHLFARGAVVSHGNFAVRDVGVPVEVAGLRVGPGDLLHGDVQRSRDGATGATGPAERARRTRPCRRERDKERRRDLRDVRAGRAGRAVRTKALTAPSGLASPRIAMRGDAPKPTPWWLSRRTPLARVAA